MAGHVVSLYLRENGYTVDTLSAKNKLDKDTYLLDITDQKDFVNFLDSRQYDVITNCVGLLVKQSEDRKDLAVYLNSYLPHFLEHYYQDSHTKIIHLSTDCVFSTNKPPYKEDSPIDGGDFYGRSKALGEIINDKDLTIRMSIIGPELRKDGSGLFSWFMRQEGEIYGYDKAMWTGVTTVELAKGTKAVIEQNLSGVYHLVPKTNISKFDLLHLLKEIFDRQDITVKPNSDVVLDKTLVNTRTDFNFAAPDYKTMVQEMKDWVDSHKELYRHYYD